MKSQSKTVLVIDDQEDERAIQRAMLDHIGYAVREATDGEDGLQLATETLPDLILLDVAMPRMDGFTVCQRLRADDRTAGIPVLLFTASVVGNLEQKAREVGANGVLTKPVDPHEVVAAIQRMIGPPRP